MSATPLLANRMFPVAIVARDGSEGYVNGHAEVGEEMFLVGFLEGRFEMWLPSGRWGYGREHPFDIKSHA